MELLLIKLVALLRPLASKSYAEKVFEVAVLGFFALLIVALLSYVAVRRTLRLSAIDLIILMFSVWCLVIYVTYIEVTAIKRVAVLLIPMLTYTLVKNVVKDRAQYTAVLLWMIVGFTIPVILSAGMITTGKGLDHVSYWTGIPRWQGAYTHFHNLGHSMTLLLMALVFYVTLTSEQDIAKGSNLVRNVLLACLAGIALYCLYMSQVRSAILGLIVFVGMYLFAINRKLLIVLATTVTAVAVLLSPYWLPVLLPDVVMVEKGQADISALGSGRPHYWLNDMKQFVELPLDQLLSGFGIGRDYEDENLHLVGHSDWLEILTNTGIVGFILFFILQIFMLRVILKMKGREKFLLLAMFSAVNVMMLVSNSYAWRIQVSHLYYIMLAFIEIPPSRLQIEKTSTATVKTA